MEKTIVISGTELRLKTNGATPFRYKIQFKKDYLAEIVKLMNMFSILKIENLSDIDPINLEKLDMTPVYNIVWVYAKTADDSIPDPMTWLSSFDEFPILDVFVQIADLAANSVKTSKKK